MRSDRYPFIAKVKLTLANGDVITETISSHVMASSPWNAEDTVDSVIREIAYDFDCNQIDAPVEGVEILSRTWA